MGVGVVVVVVMDGMTALVAAVVAVAVGVGVGLVEIPKEIGVVLVEATVGDGVLNSFSTGWHLTVLVIGNSYQFLPPIESS